MELLAAMKPAFLRFPGGNYLEGNAFNQRFNWKETIGPVEQRPGHPSPWGYWSTDGFGLLEFAEWCEDLEMEPLLGVFAGCCLGRGGVIAAGPEAGARTFTKPSRRSSISSGMPRPPSGARSGRKMGTPSRSRCTMWRLETKTGSTAAAPTVMGPTTDGLPNATTPSRRNTRN